MIGTTELFIAISVMSFGGWLCWRGIMRFREWWLSDAELTIVEYGSGYGIASAEIVFGVIALATAVSFIPGLMGIGNEAKVANNRPGPTTNAPGDILQQLVGCWRVVGEKDGQSQVIGNAIAIKLGSEPWVVTQLMDVNSGLRGITVCGFDPRTSTYNKYEVGLGKSSRHRVGVWVEQERAFKWRTEGDSEGETEIDTIADATITTVAQSPKDEKTASRLWFHRVNDPLWQPPEPTPLDSLEGRWSFRSVAKVAGRDPIENSGTTIWYRATGFPLHFELSFNEKSGRLADVRVVLCRDSRITKRWFTNDGIPMDVAGLSTPDKKGIDWSASSAESALRISERITSTDTYSTTWKLLNKADILEIEAQLEHKRLK